MVVDQVHVYRLAISEAKDDSPIPRDAHAPLSATIPFELVQPAAGPAKASANRRYPSQRWSTRDGLKVSLPGTPCEIILSLIGPFLQRHGDALASLA